MEGVKRFLRLYRFSGWMGLRYALAKRVFPSSLWDGYSREALSFAERMDFSNQDLTASRRVHQTYPEEISIRSVTWYIPEFTNPYYAGIHTILRFAGFMACQKGVKNRFVVIGNLDPKQISRLIYEAQPENLRDIDVATIRDFDQLSSLPASDVGICTLWSTAFFLLRENRLKRKFYFLQDDETRFYPAGTLSGLVEASYRFGFIGLSNTPAPARMYREEYQGQAISFYPSIDSAIFYPAKEPLAVAPYRIFWYARPGHPRNGFELCAQMFRKLKAVMGDSVDIIAAGDEWEPSLYALQGIVRNLGRLSYRGTADLYRTCHLGVVMMFTRHPSYIPFELMACGCPVVTNDNSQTRWFFKPGENCCIGETSPSSLAATIKEALNNPDLRNRLAGNGLKLIRDQYSNWDSEFTNLYTTMCMSLGAL
jgi:glycosyltransferase involved in cell wall biosynthesis